MISLNRRESENGRKSIKDNHQPSHKPQSPGYLNEFAVGTLLILLAALLSISDATNYFDTQGPSFSHEPPSRIEFTNTAGSIVDCIAHGNPPPNVEWLDKDNNPITSVSKVRHILANGSLYFPPFEAEEFRQDVHWSVYHCVATSAVGTIVSRDVVVKAVVNQRYEPEVQNPGGFLSSNVLIKCNIPSFVKEYVTVTSWLQEPNFNIYPSLEGDGKNHMLPSGELLVYNITRTDAHKIYRCRTHHKLTQDSVVSSNVGEIQLTEMRELVPPIMNEKMVKVTARLGDAVVVPCVAYANPKPVYRWHTKRANNEESIQHLLATGRAKIKDGTLIITAVEKSDSGAFFCTATNSEGSETLELQLSVTSPLTANIQPNVQTVNLGKTADLICSVNGFPRLSISWLKDGQPLRAGARVRLLSKEHIRITSIAKEDKGMYQCLVKNDFESVQGTAELRLGEVAPQLIYKFIEQTMQPGPSVSLKCSATGNPTPKIVWHLDGFPLPNNDRLMIGQYVTMFGDVISHVNISAVKSEDGGEYECKAISRAGEASHSARLNIYGMPYVRPMPKLSAVAGKTFFLKCPVAGYPIDSIIIEKVPPKITPFSFARDLNVGDRTSIQCVIGTGDLPLTFTWLKDGQPLHPAMSSAAGRDAGGGGGGISSGGKDSSIISGSGSISSGGNSISGSVSGGLISGTGDVATATGHGRHHGHGGRLTATDQLLLLSESHGDSNDDGSSGGVGGGGIGDGLVTIRQNDDFTSALSITSVTRAQSGTYTCRVQNDAATVSHSAQLKVNVPPRISPFSFEDEITEGMRTQLMCSSSQGDQPFNITWLKDGISILNHGGNGGGGSGVGSTSTTATNAGMIDASAHHGFGRNFHPPDPSLTINEYAPFSSIISIHNVTSRHNGNYTCRVTNRAGTVEYTAMLSVSVPPRWILKPLDQDAILGNPVVITCKADGFPVPSVQWKQSIGDSGEYRELSYGIGSGNSQSVIETYNNGSLIISKVGKEHEGSYLCQASNGIGAGLSTLIKLTVHVGPTVTVEKKQVTVRRGDRVTLRCEAEGDQPLDISWRAKANRIDPSYDIRYHIKESPLSRGVVSEMTILQTILSDRGEYSCIASNTYGHDRAVIHLQVQEPPNFPVNLHVTDLGSRSVTLAWSPNDQDSIIMGGGGNNRDSQPISNYILQYKKASDVWHEHNNQKLLPGDKTTAQIGGLRPAQAYHFRLYAENHLGTSAPSDILLVQTDAEVPSGRPQDVSAEPLGPQQLLITWRPPERDTWNGELLGYTIGYQKHGSADSGQNFTKVSSLGGEGLNDFRLTGLEKYTQYAITVSAFNVKGDGPPSEVALGHTLEDVPSAPPQGVNCIALTAQNIQISWQAPPKESNHGIIQGYKILYEPSNIESEYGSRETKITSALSTVLHGLQPFTNYSVQVLAFTRAGEGVVSTTVSCTTEEAVPDAPERVKSVVSSESSVIISWLPPRRPNGIVTKYNVYIRILDKGQELKILKEVLPAHNRHFEAKDLNTRESYEAWVTASTRVGQGPSTPVIKLVPSSSVPAAIISFSQTLSVSWRVDMKLACVFVGTPKPNAEWKVLNARSKKHFRLEVSNDNTLTLRNIQRAHEGNYSCVVRNAIGSDHIVYQLFVQVPPSAPVISVIGTTTNSVSLQWRVDDMGGAPLRGFTLTYRKEFGDWEEMQLERRTNSHIIENLQCGTRYQFTMITHNKIGTSSTSAIETAKTKGNKPIAPSKHSLIRPNITSALVELSSWQDGGCPILYFSIEFKRYDISSDWIIVSSRIETYTRYTIGDLEPGTPYSLRVSAHNNAGASLKEYYFETLRFNGVSGELEHNDVPAVGSLFRDVHMIAVIITSVFGTVLALIGACICFKNYPRQLFARNVDTMRPNGNGDNKDLQNREQYYGTVRKSCQQSPRESVAGLERIPEYSEDIYPYATFHLPEHENQSANIPLNRKGMPAMYDPRSVGDDNTISSTGAKVKRSISTSGGGGGGNGSGSGGGVIVGGSSGNLGGECSHTNTEKRHKRRSKAIKSESEEYDSLNSDSDISGERIRGDDSRLGRESSSGHLDEGGFNPRGHSPRGSGSGSGNKERLSVFSRPQLHKNFLRKKDSTKENSRTSSDDSPAVRIDTGPGKPSNTKYPPSKSAKDFFHAIIPSRMILYGRQQGNEPTAARAPIPIPSKTPLKILNPTSDPAQSPKLSQPIKRQVRILPRPSTAPPTQPHRPSMRPLSPSPPYRHASSSASSSTSKHERAVTPNQPIAIGNPRSSPHNVLALMKTNATATATATAMATATAIASGSSGGSASASGSNDSVGYHKRSLSSSMDPVPFDYRLFDPPPKQHKQPPSSSAATTAAAAQLQRQASSTSTQNPANHTNMSASVSSKIRSKATDTNSNSGSSSISNEFQQSSPNASLPASHIVQSGSYVEILKHANNSNGNPISQTQLERHHLQQQQQKQRSILPSVAAYHNKSYGDFLTITPRRKGKLLSTTYDEKHLNDNASDNYIHHLPHSIEPLHLLGLPNDNMSTFFDYRAMETLSNAGTLAIGSTMAGGGQGLYPKTKAYDGGGIGSVGGVGGGSGISGNNFVSSQSSIMPDEFQHILSEKSLSPPSAFSDNVSMSKA